MSDRLHCSGSPQLRGQGLGRHNQQLPFLLEDFGLLLTSHLCQTHDSMLGNRVWPFPR